MGQFCTIFDPEAFLEPLSVTWKRCLRCLTEYVEFSGIARKSLHLLQSSFNCLALNNGTLPNGVPETPPCISHDWRGTGPAINMSPRTAGAAESSNGMSYAVDAYSDNSGGDSYLMSMPFFSELESLPLDWNGFTSVAPMAPMAFPPEPKDVTVDASNTQDE